MGSIVRFGGKSYDQKEVNWSFTESVTPSNPADTSGAVGAFNVDKELNGGFVNYADKTVEIIDSEFGVTKGTIVSANYASNANKLSLSGVDELSRFTRTVTIPPYIGTLRAGLIYYCGLVGITDAQVKIIAPLPFTEQVVKWFSYSGDMWVRIKEILTVYGLDIFFRNNSFEFRQRVQEIVKKGREIDFSLTHNSLPRSQRVDLVWYPSIYVTNDFVYPIKGYDSKGQIFTVNAAETMNYVVETSTELMDVYQPTCVEFVDMNYSGEGSVYTVIGDDGLPVKPAQWRDYGGSLTVRISPDDKTKLIVDITGANNIANGSGVLIKSFRIGLASGVSGNYYPTLWVRGKGFKFDKEILSMPTEFKGDTRYPDVGYSFESKIIQTKQQAYAALKKLVEAQSGKLITASATVAAPRESGETLIRDRRFVSYKDYRDAHPNMNYAQVRDANNGRTYAGVKRAIQQGEFENDYNQTFGYVAGARFFSRIVGRWFRVLTATFTPGNTVSLTLEDDTTYSDVKKAYEGMTYAEVRAMNNGVTYGDARFARVDRSQ